MERRALFVIAALTMGLTIVACGSGERAPAKTGPDDTIPMAIGSTGWARSPDLKRFAGDSLFEYVDGAAEMYHKYGFAEVTVADYSQGENTITADLYRFKGPDRAYGMYATLRPDEPDTVYLGVEGFSFGPNIVFVKGSHIVNVYTYDDFDGAFEAVRLVAETLEAGVSGTSEKPEMFALFPEGDRVAFKEKIFAEGFLGHAFLTDVYTVDYAVGNEQLRLFISPDPDGDKLRRWFEAVDTKPAPIPEWEDGIFESGGSLWTSHDYYGEVGAGWRGGKLIGVVGYIPAFRENLVAWAASLE